MKRGQIIALAGLAILGLGVGYLALSSRQPPVLPADADHGVSRGLAPCEDCHGPAGRWPRGVNHPLGHDCLRCHGTTP